MKRYGYSMNTAVPPDKREKGTNNNNNNKPSLENSLGCLNMD